MLTADCVRDSALAAVVKLPMRTSVSNTRSRSMSAVWLRGAGVFGVGMGPRFNHGT